MTSPSLPRWQHLSTGACERLPARVWDYLSQGDSRTDLEDYRRHRVLPAPLAAVAGGHTRLKLFGQALDHPIILAPVAYQQLFHPDGEAASAIAASAQGGLSVTSSLSSQALGPVFDAASQGGGPKPWFQLYWQGNRERTARLLGKALYQGYQTIVFTIDAPIKPVALTLPADVQAVNLEAWEPDIPSGNQVFGGWMAQAAAWEDLAWLRNQVPGALIVKGILTVDDARRVVQHGCDGLVVSNHGGRVMLRAVPVLRVLPAIVAAVGSQIRVLLDSGIRDGCDVFVGLALGAQAVMVGRSYIWPLATGGALGVARRIRELRDELEMTMAQAGCSRLEDITSRALHVCTPHEASASD